MERSFEGNGFVFQELQCGLREGHRALMTTGDHILCRDPSLRGGAMTLTRLWTLTPERLAQRQVNLETSISRLQPSLVTFIVDFPEERKVDSLGLSHKTLMDAFPDGHIAGVRYVAVGYDYERRDEKALAAWSNQCNAGLAVARHFSKETIMMLSTEVEVFEPLPNDVAPGDILTCRIDDPGTFPQQVFRDFEQDRESALRRTLEQVVEFIEGAMDGKKDISIDEYFLPIVALIQRNTMRIIGERALELTSGWDSICDARGGMEDHKQWFSFLAIKEMLNKGWCRKMLLEQTPTWRYYSGVTNGVSLFKCDPDKLGRELNALRAVQNDIRSGPYFVPEDRRISC